MREVDFDRYEDWIDQGKSFAELRKDLIANGIPPEDVSDVLKSIDNHITTKKIIKLKQSRGKTVDIRWCIALKRIHSCLCIWILSTGDYGVGWLSIGYWNGLFWLA